MLGTNEAYVLGARYIVVVVVVCIGNFLFCWRLLCWVFVWVPPLWHIQSCLFLNYKYIFVWRQDDNDWPDLVLNRIVYINFKLGANWRTLAKDDGKRKSYSDSEVIASLQRKYGAQANTAMLLPPLLLCCTLSYSFIMQNKRGKQPDRPIKYRLR